MCSHTELKIIPSAENSWGIADTYDVKCIKCKKTVFAGKTGDEIKEILANIKYSRLWGREYLKNM